MLIRLRRFLDSAIGLGLLAFCLTSSLGAQSQSRPYPVSLQVLAPSLGDKKVPAVPTVTLGGWPVVLKMSADKEIGIATIDASGFPGNGGFPRSGDRGFIVFEERDGCYSWESGEVACGEADTYLEFTPGSCSGGQPPGAVPSLMLLADADSREGVNLADQFTTVGYELNDTNRQTNVVASLVVPNWFLRPQPVLDLCLGALPTPEGPCQGGAGGLNSSGVLVGLNQLVADFNQSNITTFRAFVVSGSAPGSLNDVNGDGVIEAKDAELSGFRILSREVVFRVRTSYQFADIVRGDAALGDLDGNGITNCLRCLCDSGDPSTDCQGGGGSLTPVPR
jgi:hypothetical protein